MKNAAAKLKKSLGGYTKKSVHAYLKLMDDEYSARENELKASVAAHEAKIKEQEETIASLKENEESKVLQICMLDKQIEALNAESASDKDKIKELSEAVEKLNAELDSRPSAEDTQTLTDGLKSDIERLEAANKELTEALEAAKGNARFVSELEDSLDELLECIKESAAKIKANAEQEAEAIIQGARDRAKNIEMERLRSNTDSTSRILNKLARFRDSLLK